MLAEETERLFEVALIAPSNPSILDEELDMYRLDVWFAVIAVL